MAVKRRKAFGDGRCELGNRRRAIGVACVLQSRKALGALALFAERPTAARTFVMEAAATQNDETEASYRPKPNSVTRKSNPSNYQLI
jgi:hypothetical protein